MDELRFAYQVNPKKPIRSLPEFGLIRTNKTLMLTKEQALKAMEGASLYRRFNHDTVIRVTSLNIDRLHNEKFMDEKEYEIFKTNNTVFVAAPEEPETVEIPESPSEVVEEEVPTNPTETVENIVFVTEVPQEDTISGAITEEVAETEVVEAETQVEEAVEETVESEDPSVEVDAEPVSDEAPVEENNEVEEDVVINASNKTSVNYSGKKKHHH